MTSTHDDHLQMAIDCENRWKRLSDWEREFVASVKAQLALGRRLSLKQAETLDETWERVTAKG